MPSMGSLVVHLSSCITREVRDSAMPYVYNERIRFDSSEIISLCFLFKCDILPFIIDRFIGPLELHTKGKCSKVSLFKMHLRSFS